MLRRISIALALCIGVVILPAAAFAAQAQATANGKIAGKIVDEFNGMTLPNTPVEVVGQNGIVYSDLDGAYVVELPPGTYDVKVEFAGYQERTVHNVVVVSGRTTQLDVVMFLDNLQYREELVVRADEPGANTDEASILARKRSGNILDNLSGARMRRNADSDAAQAAERIPGLSVVDNSYVFVRGLGARYSSSTLNNIQLPTTEPDKRVVPLDLFPAGMIDQMQVIKSYSPNQPGEFSGGVVAIQSLSFPPDAAFGLGFKIGGNGQTLGNDGLGYGGGGRDGFGFDDGGRALPAAIPTDQRAIRGGIFTDIGFTRLELDAMAESFSNEWTPQGERPSADHGYQAYFGNSWEKVSVVASWSFRNDWSNFAEEQNVYRVAEGALEERVNYDMETTSNVAKQAAVANVSFRATPSNRFLFENFWTHKGDKETRFFEGFNADNARNLRDSRLRWVEEDILSSKGSGSHFLSSVAGSRVSWWVAYSRADRDEPDLRETLYEEIGGVFILADESQSGFRQFIDQRDEIWDGGVDWSLFFDGPYGLPGSIQFGAQANLRDRDFQARRFRFRHLFTSNVDLSLPPEQLFTPENIGIAFELREETRNTDAYTGSHDTYAGYTMVDLPLGPRWRLVGGARYEQSDQQIDTFDPFIVGDQSAVITTDNEDHDVLPSANLVYQFHIDQNLRIGFSQTVNRPQFRELAPFDFTDVVGGRTLLGNPELVSATIRNFDARWEWFPGATEILAASVFFKSFDDPIERIVEPTAQLRTSYTNADSARNVGFELEAQKILGQFFEVGGNYTYVDSSIEISAAAGQVQTSTERPLAGTSANLVNAYFEGRVPDAGLAARLLVNWFDDRITDVGALGLPDIIEEAREKVDLVFVWQAASQMGFPDFTVRASLENLTNPEYTFSQGGEVYRQFTLGRGFDISVSWDLFQ
jgi:TonB-dependent receptor